MKRILSLSLVVSCCIAIGCAGEPEPDPAVESTPGSASVAAPPSRTPGDLDPDDPTILRRPFTAEQIREEWVQGFSLLVRARRPESEMVERWTVVEADEEGLVLEYAKLNPEGEVFGEPRRERSSWTALRDHATYPADWTTVEEVTQETPLGELEGWLYTQRNPDRGIVTEFFFARDLPGAPVHMIARHDQEIVMEILQLERSRPQ